MKRILFILPHLRGTGTERVNVMLMRGLAQRGWQTRLLLINGEIVPWDDGLDDLDIVWALEPGGSKLRHAGKLMCVLLREARQADLLIGGMELTCTYLAAIAGSIYRKPVLGWIHIDFDHFPAARRPWHYLCCQLFYPRLAAVVGVAQGTAAAFGRYVPRIKDRLHVIYNAIPVEEIRRQVGEASSSAGKTPLVAGLGRLVRQKGFDILIRAHARLIQQGIDHRLLIIGEGEERSSLEALARDLGVADSVEMPGFMANPFAALQAADVFAFPSRFEGMGVALVEALALGKAVISSDYKSGAAEILDNGEYGLLVPVEDVEALADGLKRLLLDEALASHYRTKACQRAEHFSPGSFLDQAEELIKQALTDRME